MTEISHAELEKHHYQALKNPQYQLEGMMDVLYEEMMMAMPVRGDLEDRLEALESKEIIEVHRHIHVPYKKGQKYEFDSIKE